MCECTALGWCEPCRQAFLTGPVAAAACGQPDPYATHRERQQANREALENSIAYYRRRLAEAEDELRRMG